MPKVSPTAKAVGGEAHGLAAQIKPHRKRACLVRCYLHLICESD